MAGQSVTIDLDLKGSAPGSLKEMATKLSEMDRLAQTLRKSLDSVAGAAEKMKPALSPAQQAQADAQKLKDSLRDVEREREQLGRAELGRVMEHARRYEALERLKRKELSETRKLEERHEQERQKAQKDVARLVKECGEADREARSSAFASAGVGAAAGAGLTLHGLAGVRDYLVAGQTASPFLPEILRREQANRNLPFGLGYVYRTFSGLYSAERGAPGRVADTQHQAAIADIERAANAGGYGRILPAEMEAAAAAARASSLSGFHLPALAAVNRTTAGGQIAYEERQVRQPGIDLLARAQAEQAAATRELAGATRARQAQEGVVRGRLGALGLAGDYERIVKGLPQGGTFQQLDPNAQASLHRRGVDTEQQLKDLQVEASRLEARLNEEKAKGLALTEKSRAVRQAEIGLAQAEYQIATARVQRAEADAQALGGAHEGDRQHAIALAIGIKKHGIEAYTPEEQDRASLVAGDFVRREQIKAGDRYRREDNQQLLAGGLKPEDLPIQGGLAGKVAAQEKAQANVRLQVELDPKTTAEEISRELQKYLGNLIQTVIVQTQAEIAKEKQSRANDAAAQHVIGS